MKLWVVSGIWSRLDGTVKNIGAIMWTIVAATEEEALGFVVKGMREKTPNDAIESLHAIDISNAARTFVANNI